MQANNKKLVAQLAAAKAGVEKEVQKPVLKELPRVVAVLSTIQFQYDAVGQYQCQFNLFVKNQNDKVQTVYAFVWAQNDFVIPPERGLWPMEARINNNLSPSQQLWVQNHKKGAEFILEPGETKTTSGALIASEKAPFTEIRIVLYSDDGEKIFDETKQL